MVFIKKLQYGYLMLVQVFTIYLLYSFTFSAFGNEHFDIGKGAFHRSDFSLALSSYENAAKQGHALAQFHLANLYSEGKGVEIDSVKAAIWFRKSAEQGLPQAQFMLGASYENGYGSIIDYVQAAIWYRKAAEQGLAIAQSLLGNLYFEGKAVKKNHVLSYLWYRRAAKQQNKGMLLLSLTYLICTS